MFAGSERAAEPWGAPLAAAREVAAALRARREERGSLEVTSYEPDFDFDGAGNVAGVRYEEQTESHTLIEELMILANEQVAGYLADRKLPTLYRVHERPDPPSVEAMIARMASLDVPTPPVPHNMSPQQAADVAACWGLMLCGTGGVGTSRDAIRTVIASTEGGSGRSCTR